MSNPPKKRVSAAELRKMFNDGGYWEQIKQGVLQPRLIRDRHPHTSLANEPYCTRSQYIIYVDVDGKEVAGVHQYLRMDGTLGASGRPDPKKLYVNGVEYVYDPSIRQPSQSPQQSGQSQQSVNVPPAPDSPGATES